ncbi:IS630 family transposase, partial [Candidatus Woesearchaeota archaeon]|nr:IS630 family transposase [Candidatus Woesearchaeota archaeon]
MKQFLSLEERDKLKIQHRKERDKRICDRIKAVLLFDDGWNYQEIAHVLLLSDEAVKQHIQEYCNSQKLQPENGGSFIPKQAEELGFRRSQSLGIQRSKEGPYLRVKEIVAHVEKVFGVAYTIAGMTDWLHAHGFSYKKPAVVPGKADKQAQEQWIKEYQELKNSLSLDEAICFIDGVHPTHNTKLAYGWIQKGKRKEILTNTGRQRINLSGAIDIISKKVLIREDLTLNASSTIEFLKQVEAAYPHVRRIHVFCDNARYYRNKDVQKYIKNSKLEMHFLPPYSPNLNPIERLWKFVNEKVLYNKYYEKFSDFKEAVLGFLRSLFNPCPEL